MLVVVVFFLFYFFFFFKQKTAYEIKECDWSSDVCSSDLWMRIRSSVVSEHSRRRPLSGGPVMFIQSSVPASSSSSDPSRPDPRWVIPRLVRRMDHRPAARSMTHRPR